MTAEQPSRPGRSARLLLILGAATAALCAVVAVVMYLLGASTISTPGNAEPTAIATFLALVFGVIALVALWLATLLAVVGGVLALILGMRARAALRIPEAIAGRNAPGVGFAFGAAVLTLAGVVLAGFAVDWTAWIGSAGWVPEWFTRYE